MTLEKENDGLSSSCERQEIIHLLKQLLENDIKNHEILLHGLNKIHKEMHEIH